MYFMPRISNIIEMVAVTTMFMVLSSWHNHCKSSPGSFIKCRTSSGWRPNFETSQLASAEDPPKLAVTILHSPSPFTTTIQYSCYFLIIKIMDNE